MQTMVLNKKTIAVDEDGCLLNFDDWDEEAAQELARQAHVVPLDQESMSMFRFIRDYYERFNFCPIVNAICKNLHEPKDCMSEAFPDSLVAWKLAGLPHPEEPVVSLLEAGQSPG